MTELVDLRAKITDESDAVLAAMAQAKRCTKAEVVRDVLHEWALVRMREAKILTAQARFKGDVRAAEGTEGSV